MVHKIFKEIWTELKELNFLFWEGFLREEERKGGEKEERRKRDDNKDIKINNFRLNGVWVIQILCDFYVIWMIFL